MNRARAGVPEGAHSSLQGLVGAPPQLRLAPRLGPFWDPGAGTIHIFTGSESRKARTGVFAVAPSALRLALVVALVEPGIPSHLQRLDRTVDLLATGNAIELVEHRLVQPLGDIPACHSPNAPASAT